MAVMVGAFGPDGRTIEIITPHSLIRFRRTELNDLIRALLKELNRGAAPTLVNAEPLVMYFETDADREEMIKAFKTEKPNTRAIKV